MASYKIVKERRAWWPVSWKGVSEDGEIVTNTIEMRFRLMKVDEAFPVAREVDKLRVDEAAADAGAQLVERYATLVASIADNWRGVEAENGDALPFNPENLRLLMNEPGLFTHVFEAFRDCLNARETVKEGN